MDLFITRFRAKARLGGLVQSRVKSLEKMEKRDKLEAIKDLEFAFAEKPGFHKYALDVRDLSFAYTPDRPLIRRLLDLASGPRTGSSSSAGTAAARRPCSGSSPGT